MGIDGLLPLLKPITKKTHISQFRKQTLAVDMSPWLYIGCYGGVMGLAEQDLGLVEGISDGEATHSVRFSCANYIIDMINLFEANQVTIFGVFDGRSLESKKNTISKRQNLCSQSLKKAKKLLQQNQNKKKIIKEDQKLSNIKDQQPKGQLQVVNKVSFQEKNIQQQNSIPNQQQEQQIPINNQIQPIMVAPSSVSVYRESRKQARKHIARSIRVSEDIVIQAMTILKSKNIQFIMAPYQADCQLVALQRAGIVDGIVSQDSDIIAYGSNLITKLDEQGMCQYIDLTVKYQPQELKPQQESNTQRQKFCKQLAHFLKFDRQTRLSACILSGCDYVSSIKGIGMKKSIDLLVSMNGDLGSVLQKLRDHKVYGQKIEDGYEEKVLNAVNVFTYATVYNPLKKTLQNLKSIDKMDLNKYMQNEKPQIQSQTETQNLKLLKIVGNPYQQYLNLKMWTGDINPRTLTPRIFPPPQSIRACQNPFDSKNSQPQQTSLKELADKHNLSINQMEQQPTSSVIENNMFEALLEIVKDSNKDNKEGKDGKNSQKKEQEVSFYQKIINQCVEHLFPF